MSTRVNDTALSKGYLDPLDLNAEKKTVFKNKEHSTAYKDHLKDKMQKNRETEVDTGISSSSTGFHESSSTNTLHPSSSNNVPPLNQKMPGNENLTISVKITNETAAIRRPRRSSFRDDFILVSEFSELEGPIPLFILPDKCSIDKGFINSIVLRMMSVDYQSNKSVPIIGSEPSSNEDTQVFLDHPLENAFSYVYHFTLFDIYARGFVRPICMSFVTHEKSKIINHFTEFSERFSKIANLLKQGNREVYESDVNALKLTALGDSTSFKAMIEVCNDINIGIEKDQKSNNDSDLKNENNDCIGVRDEKCESQENIPSSNDSTTTTNTKEMDQVQVNTNAKRNGSATNQEETQTSLEDLGKQKENYGIQEGKLLVQSLSSNTYFNRERLLRNLLELCGSNAHSNALLALRTVHAHFSRPSIVLLLERRELPHIVPLSALLVIGGTVMLSIASRHENFSSLENSGIISEFSKTSSFSGAVRRLVSRLKLAYLEHSNAL